MKNAEVEKEGMTPSCSINQKFPAGIISGGRGKNVRRGGQGETVRPGQRGCGRVERGGGRVSRSCRWLLGKRSREGMEHGGKKLVN